MVSPTEPPGRKGKGFCKTSSASCSGLQGSSRPGCTKSPPSCCSGTELQKAQSCCAHQQPSSALGPPCHTPREILTVQQQGPALHLNGQLQLAWEKGEERRGGGGGRARPPPRHLAARGPRGSEACTGTNPSCFPLQGMGASPREPRAKRREETAPGTNRVIESQDRLGVEETFQLLQSPQHRPLRGGCSSPEPHPQTLNPIATVMKLRATKTL